MRFASFVLKDMVCHGFVCLERSGFLHGLGLYLLSFGSELVYVDPSQVLLAFWIIFLAFGLTIWRLLLRFFHFF